MVPSSMTGRKLSCWARLKRWISSTNSSVCAPALPADARALEHLLEIGDAGKNRRNLLEGKIGLVGQQPGDRRLAGSRRPQKIRLPSLPERDHAGQRAALAGQVLLPDHVGEALRAQAVGQRAVRACRRAAGLAKQIMPWSRRRLRLPDELPEHAAVAFENNDPPAAFHDELPYARTLGGDLQQVLGAARWYRH